MLGVELKVLQGGPPYTSCKSSSGAPITGFIHGFAWGYFTPIISGVLYNPTLKTWWLWAGPTSHPNTHHAYGISRKFSVCDGPSGCFFHNSIAFCPCMCHVLQYNYQGHMYHAPLTKKSPVLLNLLWAHISSLPTHPGNKSTRPQSLWGVVRVQTLISFKAKSHATGQRETIQLPLRGYFFQFPRGFHQNVQVPKMEVL